MLTSVEKTIPYRVIDLWYKKKIKTPNEQDQELVKCMEELLRRFREYQEAKEKFFQPDADGELPRISKKDGEYVCQKYDDLMEFYKCHAQDFSAQPVSTIYNGSSYLKSLTKWLDHMFKEIRKQDEESVEMLRNYSYRLEATQKGENIQEIGTLDCPYPFHTGEEVEQLKDKMAKKLSPRRLCPVFEDLATDQPPTVEVGEKQGKKTHARALSHKVGARRLKRPVAQIGLFMNVSKYKIPLVRFLFVPTKKTGMLPNNKQPLQTIKKSAKTRLLRPMPHNASTQNLKVPTIKKPVILKPPFLAQLPKVPVTKKLNVQGKMKKISGISAPSLKKAWK